MIKVKYFCKSTIFSLLLLSWTQTSHASHILEGELEFLSSTDLKTTKHLPKLIESNSYSDISKFTPFFTQSLKEAEDFQKQAQTFQDKQLARQKIKDAVLTLKKKASSYCKEGKYQDSAYIWNIIFSKHPDYMTSEDMQDASFIFYQAHDYKSALDITKELISRREVTVGDFRNFLHAFNRFSSFDQSYSDIAFDACQKIHNSKYKSPGDECIISEALDRIDFESLKIIDNREEVKHQYLNLKQRYPTLQNERKNSEDDIMFLDLSELDLSQLDESYVK